MSHFPPKHSRPHREDASKHADAAPAFPSKSTGAHAIIDDEAVAAARKAFVSVLAAHAKFTSSSPSTEGHAHGKKGPTTTADHADVSAVRRSKPSPPPSRGAPSDHSKSHKKHRHDAAGPHGAHSSALPAAADLIEHKVAACGAGVSDSPVIAGDDKINRAFLSDTKFTDAAFTSKVSRETCRALNERFKFEHMSKVQAATLPVILDGRDVFARAKTGSGKTLAFLIPLLEMTLRLPSARRAGDILSLVIAPTRELALQIEKEAEQLIAFHPGVRVSCVIGGRPIQKEQRFFKDTSCTHILIATPGRLVDHIESTHGFVHALSCVKALVLDEADRLLDMGFKPALDKILACLPKAGRQTLLFSATVPPGVRQIADATLQSSAQYIDCMGEEVSDTHEHVPQEYFVVPNESVLPALARVLEYQAKQDPDHKIIVFFPTARFTGFAAAVFDAYKRAGGYPFKVLEIHSRKSQSARNTAAETFRKGKGLIIFSSDVSARGMDFPDVSRVIQVGLTDREQYIHRLGRTARAGKSGAGLLLLASFERRFIDQLTGIPIKPAPTTSTLTGGVANGIEWNKDGSIPIAAPAALSTLLGSLGRFGLESEATKSYVAWMGFYNSNLKRVGWTKPVLVAEANKLFLSFGLSEIPMVPRDTLGKMGLRGVAGIREGPKGWKPSHGE